MNADDERWLQTLAGAGQRDTPPATRLEAELLATGLKALAGDAAAAGGSSASQARRDALLAALDSEPHNPRRPWWHCAGCSERWRRWRGDTMPAPALAGLAFVLSLSAVLWTWAPWRDPAPEAGLLRSGVAVQLLVHPQPQAQRDALAQALLRQGAEVRRYQRLGRYGLQADLPTPVPADLQALLAAAGLPAIAGATLQVEYEAQR
jgi:hypothetical protein